MTTFDRSGHYRTSKYGYRHWVAGHEVHRDDWSRSYSRLTSGEAMARLRPLRATRSWIATFVNPNAKCPVCQADVYYYQNEYGSRVYFDSIPWPWPKHPCTDNARGSRRKPLELVSPVPIARDSAEVSEIRRLRGFAGLTSHNPTSDGRIVAELRKRISAQPGTFLVLRAFQPEERLLYVAVKRLPRSVTAGAIVSIASREVSFMDPATLEQRDLPCVRFRSGAAFISGMLEESLDFG